MSDMQLAMLNERGILVEKLGHRNQVSDIPGQYAFDGQSVTFDPG